MTTENYYIIFYKILDGTILSYVRYRFVYDESEKLLNPFSKDRCANNNGLSIENIGIKKWKKENPQESDFKDNINDLNENDLENIE